jgi:hypothetical protein
MDLEKDRKDDWKKNCVKTIDFTYPLNDYAIMSV